MLLHWLVILLATVKCRLRAANVRRRASHWSSERGLGYANMIDGYREWEHQKYGNNIAVEDRDQFVLSELATALRSRHRKASITLTQKRPTLPDSYWIMRIEQGSVYMSVDWNTKHGFGIANSAALRETTFDSENLYLNFWSPNKVARYAGELLDRAEKKRAPPC